MKVVIAGGGFGGLACAQKLEKITPKDWKIILIDRNKYLLYTPTIYEVATTSETLAGNLALERIVTFPYDYTLKRTKLIQAEITAFDSKNKRVLLKTLAAVDYDYLVVALGAVTNFFGISGSEVSIPLKNLYDAIRIRDAVETVIQQHKYDIDEPAEIKLAIIGGGANGVETAGELAQWLKRLQEIYHKKFSCRLAIFEAGPTILGPFPPMVQKIAKKRLEKLGVEIKESVKIEAIDSVKKQIICDKKRCFDFDVLIWAAGVKASDIVQPLNLKTEKRGRVIINDQGLCLPTDEHLHFQKNIFIIGDSACLVNPKTNQPLGQMARIAIEQGKVVAKNIVAREQKKILSRYRFVTYPAIIPIGGRWAIFSYKKLVIWGWPAWIIKGLVELAYLLETIPLGKALGIWLHGLKIFLKND